jgi:SDR family mycofactocin-dependent oxidoreductase
MSDRRLDGKVALITGAARGQGRSHAVTFAREGARVALCDLVEPAETLTEVEAAGGQAVWAVVDTRDSAGLRELVESAASTFGGIDIVLANAGVRITRAYGWELEDDDFEQTVAVNLVGPWKAAKSALPHMIEAGRGGSIVFTGSAAAAISVPRGADYAASKHGLVGLMRTLAVELAPHNIRVNIVSPSIVNTPMVMQPEILGAWLGKKEATVEEVLPSFRRLNALPNPWIEPEDVSNAIVFLVSDAGRYITGVDLPVDAGTRALPPTGPLPHLEGNS